MPPLPPPPTLGLDQAVSALLAALQPYVPPPAPPLPDSGVSVAALTERSVGLGGRRGFERRGSLGLVELRGVRADALVRFQLWGGDFVAVETTARTLTAAIAADREALWNAGFLRLSLDQAGLPFEVPSLTAWTATLDYRVLFEHRVEDTGGAESLIARIPVHSDPEEEESLARETTTVTDELVRWDELVARPLVVRGPRAVRSLASLSFFAGALPTGTVTLTRTHDGASGPPTPHPSLTAFLEEVSGPGAPERHGVVSFASPPAFLAELAPPGATLELGDWDLDSAIDTYEARDLALTPPLLLPRGRDRLELTYQHPALDQSGVIYLRAG
jgi:hypothetical protein